MAIFWYLLVTLFGALGALAVLRVLERLIFGGGGGSLLVQAGLGLGFLMLAKRALNKARAKGRPSAERAAPRPSSVNEDRHDAPPVE